MSNVVFILGAGASKDAGAPLMNDFLDKARDLLSINDIDGKEENFRQVFRAISELQKVHSKSNLDISNIEAIFTAFEMAKLLNINESIFNDDLISSLKVLIATTIKKTLKFPIVNQSLQAPKPYGALANLITKLQQSIPQKTVSIITFNYDIAIDYSLYLERIKYKYFLENSGEGIPLLKLHGSLNWFYCKECNKTCPYNVEQFVNAYISRKIFTNNNEIEFDIIDFDPQDQCCRNIDKYSPFIVPPTNNKSGYYETLPLVWKQAAKELQEAESIIVCGYSMPETDSFFHYLYSLGTISDSILRSFLLYDPDAKDIVKDRFEKIIGVAVKPKFKYKRLTFKNAISDIASEFGIKLL